MQSLNRVLYLENRTDVSVLYMLSYNIIDANDF
jgi:hypothetical protein